MADNKKQQLPPPDDDDEGSTVRDSKGRFASSEKRPSGASLEGQLLNLFEAIGGAVFIWNYRDGQIIAVQAAPLAKALNKLAQQNAKVKRLLQAMTTGGAWGEVMSIVVLGMVLPIAQNHGFEFPWQKVDSGIFDDSGNEPGDNDDDDVPWQKVDSEEEDLRGVMPPLQG